MKGRDTPTKTLIGAPIGNGAPARPQAILTPQSIIDVCLEVWPTGIELDPCTAEGSIVPARRVYTVEQDGLKQPWAPRTYINPPYNNLKAWFEHGLKQPSEQIWLVPVRPHRAWWRRFASKCLLICWLDSGLTFLHYTQPYPVPLLLAYRGTRSYEFARAASKLGEVMQWRRW